MKLLAAISVCALTLATGCRTPPPRPPVAAQVVARVFLEAGPGETGATVTLPVSGARLEIDPRPILLEFDLRKVERVTGEFGPALLFYFSPSAARDLYRKSAGALGRRLVLSLNGAFVAAVPIENPVSTGTLLFYPELPPERIDPLLAGLQQTIGDLQARLARER